MECFENIAWLMAKQANDNVPDEPDEWLDQFEMFSIYEILPQLAKLWGLSQKTTVKAKKNKGHRKGS